MYAENENKYRGHQKPVFPLICNPLHNLDTINDTEGIEFKNIEGKEEMLVTSLLSFSNHDFTHSKTNSIEPVIVVICPLQVIYFYLDQSKTYVFYIVNFDGQ